MSIKLLKIITIILLLFSTFSCARYLYKQNQKLQLDKTTLVEFNKMRISKSKNVNVNLDNDTNNYKIIESTINHADGPMKYIYAFKNDTLIYFGYPYQFSQHPDNTIIELGKYYNIHINIK